MKINSCLLKKIKQLFSEKPDRSVFQDYFKQRNEETMAKQQTMFFRANRLWQQGNDRVAGQILYKDKFSIDQMSKGEFLRSEAVLESLKEFSETEYVYFEHCVQNAVQKRMQIETEKDSVQRLKTLAGWFISGFYAGPGSEPGSD